MAATVQHITEESFLKQTAGGWEARRAFWVYGLEGTTWEVLKEALDAVGIEHGDEYSETDPDLAGLVAREPEARPMEDQPYQVKVTVDYSTSGGGGTDYGSGENDDFSLSISGSLVTVPAYENNEGDPLEVTYASDTKRVVSEGVRALGVIEFTRTEDTTRGDLLQKFVTYVGKVNQSTVTLDGQSFAARTLLILPFTAEEVRRNERYRVTYRFQWKENTWDRTIAYRFPDGTIPADADSDAIKDEAVLDEVNLAAML